MSCRSLLSAISGVSNNNDSNDVKKAASRRSGGTDPTSQGQSPEWPPAHGIRVFDILLVFVVPVGLRGGLGSGLDDPPQRCSSVRAPGEAEHQVSDRAEAQLQVGSTLQLFH